MPYRRGSMPGSTTNTTATTTSSPQPSSSPSLKLECDICLDTCHHATSTQCCQAQVVLCYDTSILISLSVMPISILGVTYLFLPCPQKSGSFKECYFLGLMLCTSQNSNPLVQKILFSCLCLSISLYMSVEAQGQRFFVQVEKSSF